MSAKIAEATVVAEEPQIVEEPTTLLGACLKDAGIEVKKEEKPEAEPSKPEVVAGVETPEIEAEAEETVETAEEPEKAEKTEDPKVDKDAKPVLDEWPDSAKQRVKEEADKRRARTEERDRAILEAQAATQKAQQLETQLQQALNQRSAPQPTESDPLADVTDGPSLMQVVKLNESLLEFAELHPNGAEAGEVIGKNLDGSEIKLNKDMAPEETIRMKLHAEKVLRRHVPAKANQLQQAQAMAEEVRKDYPDIFVQGSDDNKQAVSAINSFPDLRKSPDHLLWVAWAIEGRKAWEARKNGSKVPAKEETVEAKAAAKILAAPKVKPAPSVVKNRVEAEKPSGDIESALKRLQKENSEEARLAVIAAKLTGRRSGVLEPALA